MADQESTPLTDPQSAGELQEEAVIRKSRITAFDGKRCLTGFYHLHAVKSEDYRVNSVRATQLRQGDAE